MAGRNRLPRHPDDYRVAHEDPRSHPHRIPIALPPHPASLEEELEFQHRDIQRLISENRHVVDDNVMLQRELTSKKDEIHRLNQVIPKMHAEKEAQKRELIERVLKLEAEISSTEPVRAEVGQLRGEAQKLDAKNKELSSQLQSLTKDINRLKSENMEVAAMKGDIDKMHKDLVDTRRVFEYERKGNEELVEQNRSMEKNLIAMAREIEKLRAEQTSSERRPWDVGGYGAMNGNFESRYSGPYIPGSWGSYDKFDPPRR